MVGWVGMVASLSLQEGSKERGEETERNEGLGGRGLEYVNGIPEWRRVEAC